MQPEEKLRHLLGTGGVLADRVRLAVALYLSLKREARFKEVAEGLDISPGNLAHHLKVMEDVGYVKVEKTWEDMRARVLSLTPDGINAVATFMSVLREVQPS
jgi:DNA-binding MarR family transcriptional regulator